MSDFKFNPIDTAPRDGTAVYVLREDRPLWGSHLLGWNPKSKRWEGMSFATMGPLKIFWDTKLVQPTHWLPATPERNPE